MTVGVSVCVFVGVGEGVKVHDVVGDNEADML